MILPETFQPKIITPVEKNSLLQYRTAHFRAGNVLNQLHINFRALSGVMATGSSQIFANEDNAGAKNVGVVIFSIQDPANTFNVLSATGSSRSVYPVMSSALNNSSWKFSTRMQKNRSSAECHLWPTDKPCVSGYLLRITDKVLQVLSCSMTME